jgi:hypothetical protein
LNVLSNSCVYWLEAQQQPTEQQHMSTYCILASLLLDPLRLVDMILDVHMQMWVQELRKGPLFDGIIE